MAGFVFATGVTSMTEGRMSPILYVGADTPTFAMTLTSVGVKTQIYYHSGYIAAISTQRELQNRFRGGFGLGVHFANRFYKDGTLSQKRSDVAIGPTLRVNWEFLPAVIIGIEGFYGIRNTMTLMNVNQTITSLVLGVRF